MPTLLQDALLPLTSTIGFVEADCARAAAAYLAWRNSIKDGDWVTRFTSRPVAGTLSEVLRGLLPLKQVEANRRVFVPTSGAWTAYFDNGWTGADPFPVLSCLLDALRCRAVRMTSVAPPRFGATIFELLDPVQGPPPLRVLRSIGVLQEGTRWRFDTVGAPLPFEETEPYTRKRIRDRFDADLLDRYLRTLGIAAFDERFYLPEGQTGVLIEADGAINGPRNLDISLAQAQHGT